ncbi:MAG: hypothetical protein QM664_01735 [Flavihumibacter sp.]
MKKFLLPALAAIVLLTSCHRVVYAPGDVIDEHYWLSRERGVVRYSDDYCRYFTVETYNGFSILKAYGYAPYSNVVIYGDLSRSGVGTFYNRTEGYLFEAEVKDYWLTYWDAVDGINWFCGR